MEKLDIKLQGVILEWNKRDNGFIKILKLINLDDLEKIVKYLDLTKKYTYNYYYLNYISCEETILGKATNDQMILLLTNDFENKLDLRIEISKLYNIILDNNIQLIKSLCNHKNFNFNDYNFNVLLTGHCSELENYNIIINNNYVMENKKINSGILTFLKNLKDINDKINYIIYVLSGAKLANNKELINAISSELNEQNIA